MARKREDLTGHQFGELSVASFHDSNPPRWNCECSCGEWVVVRANNLKSGNTTSCGCQRRGRTRLERSLARLETFPGILVIVARDRGPSTANSCVSCGQQAKQWMSDGSCSDLRRTEEATVIYSWCKHPEHYVPVCHRCSGAFVEKRAWWADPEDEDSLEQMPVIPQRTGNSDWNQITEVYLNPKYF